MPRRPRRLVGALALASLLAACGGRGCRAGDGAAEEEPAPKEKKAKPAPSAARRDPPSSDGCQRWADATCRRDAECYPSSLYYSDVDEGACRRSRKASCDLEAKLPGAEPVVAARGACGAAIEELGCRAWSEAEVVPACDAKGTRADGQPCVSWSQCASAYCNARWDERCGKCDHRPKDGEPCPDFACDSGLRCGDDKRCHPLAKKGGDCTNDWDCHPGLACVQPARWKPGVCGEPLHEGERCLDPWGSTGDAGVADAAPPSASPLDLLRGGERRPPGELRSCDYTAGLDCVRGRCAKTEFHAPGDSCATGEHCKGGRCKDGKCERWREEGESCSEPMGECRWPARCVGDRCEPPSTAWCEVKGKPGARPE